MRLEGLHHVTAITADAPGNVEFYARLLGLRMVKKTVNFDAPDVYHLYYGAELGQPGSAMTFFEFPGAARGRAGAGMVHRIAWRVGGKDALDFWSERLAGEGVETTREGDALRFADPEGLELELVVASAESPLRAESADIPAEHALLGFDGVRAFASEPAGSTDLLTRSLGFTREGEGYRAQGDERSARYVYDAAPGHRPVQGAGTVHHVAWASRDEDHEAWRARAIEGGAQPTPVIDRDYFLSIYFREPSGVLFEIATLGPGFTVDEDAEHLGERLQLPAGYESMREELERRLTPLTNPRARGAVS